MPAQRTLTTDPGDHRSGPKIKTRRPRQAARLWNLVDQPGYGTNRPYFIDIIKVCLKVNLLNSTKIRHLYVKSGFSAAQVAEKFGVAKSVIVDRIAELGIKKGSLPASRYDNPKNYRRPNAPFGFSMKRSTLVPNKAELRVCRVVVELMGRKKLSATATGKELQARGFKNRAGRTNWDHTTVINIFKRWHDKL